MMRNLELNLPADPTAPGLARRRVADSGVVPVDRLEDVLLLVSELVSNAVKHGSSAGETIEVRVTSAKGRIRVEVEDSGTDLNSPAGIKVPDRTSAEGGLGLRLMDAVADRWGIDSSPSTVVWFELESV